MVTICSINFDKFLLDRQLLILGFDAGLLPLPEVLLALVALHEAHRILVLTLQERGQVLSVLHMVEEIFIIIVELFLDRVDNVLRKVL